MHTSTMILPGVTEHALKLEGPIAVPELQLMGRLAIEQLAYETKLQTTQPYRVTRFDGQMVSSLRFEAAMKHWPMLGIAGIRFLVQPTQLPLDDAENLAFELTSTDAEVSVLADLLLLLDGEHPTNPTAVKAVLARLGEACAADLQSRIDGLQPASQSEVLL